MFVSKIYEGDGMFENPSNAIDYMVKNNFDGEVSVYDIDSDKAYKKTKEIYESIKCYNKGKQLNDQILPGNPFPFRGILGCLGVQVYTITLGTYKNNHESIALFSGYNDSVLDTSIEESNIIPGSKALASLAMLSRLYMEMISH